MSVDQLASIFDTDPGTYGHIVSRQARVMASSTLSGASEGAPQLLVAEQPVVDFAFYTAAEINPWIEIDLGREVSVTDVRVLNRLGAGQAGQLRAAMLRLSLSLDGKTWLEIWKADRSAPEWKIPVTGARNKCIAAFYEKKTPSGPHRRASNNRLRDFSSPTGVCATFGCR